MTKTPLNILHVSSSPQPQRSGQQFGGSHSRELTGHFLDRWRQTRPDDLVVERDVGTNPPAAVTRNWLRGSFSDPATYDDSIRSALAESDVLAHELLKADVIVAGVAVYNFGVPAQLKAWIDNIVRVGLTFSVTNGEKGMLAPGKHLVIATSAGSRESGDVDSGADAAIAAVREPLFHLGVSKIDVVSVYGALSKKDYFEASLAAAFKKIDVLVGDIQKEFS
ncbi:MAG: NAD(P)H-dependent oxidoreductase [Acetobacter aceti]|nr:NAD(P)H-dependent oxidoreductase [Acetobacter aceti]